MNRRDDENDDDRITKSLAGLAVILVLAVMALLLTNRLRIVSMLEDCLMSGRTNCISVGTSTGVR